MTAAAETGLARAFFERDPTEVAPELLNKVLVHGGRAGRIVEVEAYRGTDDPASHAYRGPTPRTEVMFGPPGHLYVYFSYGMHWCANVVTSPDGTAGAVLLRALAPLRGVEAMGEARGSPARPVDIANGPAKLCQAMAIDRAHGGVDLCEPGVARTAGPWIGDDGTPPPGSVATGPRVGISVAVDRAWRFAVPDDPHCSRPRLRVGPTGSDGRQRT